MEANNQKTNRFLSLPNFGLDSIYADYSLEAITKIRKEYLKEDSDKNEMLKDMIGHVILKDVPIEQLVKSAKEKLKLDNEKSTEVALIILCEILCPIKSYFPGVEDEILKLGGEVPKEKPQQLTEQLLKREEEMERIKEAEERKEIERMSDTIIRKPIKDLLEEFPIVGEQKVGSQESIKIKSMPVPMKPLIKFWLEDYKEKMGYYNHSNLERVQYVYHEKNTKNMNEEERRQLNLVLKSVDEKIPLPYSTRMRKIDFSQIE